MICKCGNEFEPIKRNGIIVSKICVSCVIKKAKTARKKTWSVEKRKRKLELKTKSEWLKDLQTVFNTYIRERDKNKPCISCGRVLPRKYDAGHYFSVGAYPNLRFKELNVHGQCVECNQHKHGNIQEYIINLPNRIGQDAFNELLSMRKEQLKLTIPEIKELIIKYKNMTKNML